MQFPIQPDTPELDEARLRAGLVSFANQLAELIPALPAATPVLVDGDWGSGKTTVLRAVQRRLDPDTDGRTAWFNPWRHEGGHLLAALIRAVWEARSDSWKATDTAVDTLSTLWRLALAVGTRAAPALLTVAGMPVGAAIAAAARPDAAHATAAHVPGFGPGGPGEDPVAKLWSSFRVLVEEGWPDWHQPLVVFVDDLDRCNPTAMVALLDGLKLLVSCDEVARLNVRFLVALDRTVAARAVAAKFAGIDHYEGHRYLEKIFPLALRIPSVDGIDAVELIDRLTRGASGGLTADQQDALRVSLGDPAFANPRLMKRCLNTTHLVLGFETRTLGPGVHAEPWQDHMLVKWIAAVERWPGLRILARTRDESWWIVLRQALEGRQTIPPAAQTLVAQDGAARWLLSFLPAAPPGAARNMGHFLTSLRATDDRLRRWGL